jgi:hypothetical protein
VDKNQEAIAYTPWMPTDKTKCAINDECDEYKWDKETHTIGFIGAHSTYPAERGYYFDLNSDRTKNSKILANLQRENWIDEDTAAIQVSWSINNAWTETVFTFTANIELTTFGDIVTREFKSTNIFLYGGVDGLANTSPLTIQMVFYTLLLIHFILFFIKIIFELSLGISRFTNMFEMINLGFMFTMIITEYTNIIFQQRLKIDLADDNKFVYLHNIKQIDGINTMSMTICTLFFPFRIFQCLAHFEVFKPAKVVINTLIRTTPGGIVYGVLVLIILICVSTGLHIAMASVLPEFSTF